MIAVVDGDNFFASVEQLLDPKLRGKPVVVFGSNDGNCISRSKEAKALEVPMGAARHTLAPLIAAGTVIARSGNFATYEVMSRRLEWAVNQFSAITEPYSCDELFIDLGHIGAMALPDFAAHLRRQVTRWTGLPVSVGVGPTKTIAKAAIERAKHETGVYVAATPAHITELLAATSIEDVWGIGSRKAAILRNEANFTTALDLRDASLPWVRRRLSVVTARTLLELRGQVAFPLITERATPHEIMVSRAFGHPLMEIADLREAVSYYTARAAEKLRARGCCTAQVSVWVATNPFRKKERQYSNTAVMRLDHPTDHTPTLLAATLKGLERVYRPFPFHRAGVRLSLLSPAQCEQGRIWSPQWTSPHDIRLMTTIDTINQRFGRETIRFLGSGLVRPWAAKADARSPRVLTCWAEVPMAYLE